MPRDQISNAHDEASETKRSTAETRETPLEIEETELFARSITIGDVRVTCVPGNIEKRVPQHDFSIFKGGKLVRGFTLSSAEDARTLFTRFHDLVAAGASVDAAYATTKKEKMEMEDTRIQRIQQEKRVKVSKIRDAAIAIYPGEFKTVGDVEIHVQWREDRVMDGGYTMSAATASTGRVSDYLVTLSADPEKARRAMEVAMKHAKSGLSPDDVIEKTNAWVAKREESLLSEDNED